MAFDIMDVLGTVSKADAGQEQIVYIDLDKLDGDPSNFYTLEGIEDLADNISLIGLQQPLRIRPGTDGHFVIVSGHRRRAACQLIADGDTENAHMFDRGVPCIIDNDECSSAMRELRLIFANSGTRVMSPAEISRQAERVEADLYQLAEEGIEFKGRMRDHVAKACAVSKSKIARLHAIRNNLAPGLLEEFDAGRLNESVAYELQKLPQSGQEEILKSIRRCGDTSFINLRGAEYCAKYAEKFIEAQTCEDGGACDHHEKRFVQVLRAPYPWEYCAGGCCLQCRTMKDCGHPCSKAKAKQKVAAEERKEEKAAADEKRKQREAEDQARYRAIRQEEARRLLPLIEAKKLKDKAQLPGPYYANNPTVKEYRATANGDFGDAHFYHEHLIPVSLDGLVEMADCLGCSIDYIVGRSATFTPEAGFESVSEPNTTLLTAPASESNTAAPEWHREPKPPREGRYFCLVDMNTTTLHEQRCDWRDGQWYAFGMPLRDLFTVVAWWPLPPEAPHPEWWSGMDDDTEDEEDVDNE